VIAVSPVTATLAPGIYAVPDCLSAEECAFHISASEQLGYEAATINTRKGAVRDAGVRDNDRVIYDDVGLAALLWLRLRDYLPRFLDGRQAVGLNERFRFYRYEQGQRFAGHVDGVYRRSSGEESRLTLMLYLNDDFEGGETAFLNATVKPERGTALVFRHELFHEGREVTRGRKYVLRSDVMFNPPGRVSG
jgi:predicted 2-oxoglutarate/Fe(II)-dependent dioxygenase YbiX